MHRTGFAAQTAVALLAIVGAAICFAGEPSPDWAYPDVPKTNAPPPAPPAIDEEKSLPDSKIKFKASELKNFFSPPDWYPGDHPPMPPLAATGAKPDVFACGFCHLPSGLGRPENAPIAGLPADYIIRQVKDIASGARKSSVPDHYPQALMMKLSPQAVGESGLKEAADYFAALPMKSMTRIVEADIIPRVDISHWIWKKAAAGGTEPLGNRLIEVPEDYDRFLLRDGHMSYTAYFPPGSIAKGETLVKTGGDGKTAPCAACHGPDLKGMGLAPPIAGRSPSYISRQLFDMRLGVRNGEGAQQMKPVVANLSNGDIIAITAYLASQEP